MAKFVVSGYIGFDNFGDEAIASVLCENLKKNNAEKITLISSNPEKTAKMYGVYSTGMLNFFKPILETDFLISGGGSLLQDVTSLKSLLYYLAVICTALILNKKVIIFAQGFTPFRTKIGKILTKIVLKKCYKVSVRDLKSQQLLQEMGIESQLVSDPVFGIKIPQKIEHNGVGIQLRSFPTLTDSFLDKLADQMMSRFGDKSIKLISLQDSLDLPILENFGQKLTNRGVCYQILKNLDTNSVIEEISRLEFLIGMRFHANLVAAKSNVKVLGINYDIKVKTLAEELGFPILELGDDEDLGIKFDKLVTCESLVYNIPEFKLSLM